MMIFRNIFVSLIRWSKCLPIDHRKKPINKNPKAAKWLQTDKNKYRRDGMWSVSMPICWGIWINRIVKIEIVPTAVGLLQLIPVLVIRWIILPRAWAPFHRWIPSQIKTWRICNTSALFISGGKSIFANIGRSITSWLIICLSSYKKHTCTIVNNSLKLFRRNKREKEMPQLPDKSKIHHFNQFVSYSFRIIMMMMTIFKKMDRSCKTLASVSVEPETSLFINSIWIKKIRN